MRIFITGATGLVGRRLVADRLERGDAVVALSRGRERAMEVLEAGRHAALDVVEGDPTTPGPWQAHVEGCDAVVHLAGASVADRRWTPAYKRTLESSRVDSTRAVVEAMRDASSLPGVLVCASAIGWYGETGSEAVDEHAEAPRDADDFLAALAAKWEAEAVRAEDLGARVVRLRIGVVLDPRGGALGSLVPLFRFGVGGPVGSGRQYVSWIHWRDLIGLVDLALGDPDLRGPLNATAPHPVPNRAFSRALGRALGRPSWLPAPTFGLRLALGEFGRYAAMSQRVVPAKAAERGYAFAHPEIEPAMRSLLA